MGSGIIEKRSQDLVDYAYQFSKKKHGGQKRKYTGECYVDSHCVPVAKIVQAAGGDIDMICASLLHDVLEDTDCTYKELASIEHGFYHGIADLVLSLTDVSKPSDGNRAVRKRIDRQYLAGACDRAKTIKLADIINNSESILEHDPSFANVYLAEMRLLVPLLKGGNSELWLKANRMING